MILGSVTKQPAETFKRYIDFARRLQTSPAEAITVQAVTSKNALTGTDTTTTMISEAAINGTKIEARLKAAGVAGEDHIVQMRATTDLGNSYEDEFSVAVREE
jgi:hypothetical protein